MASWNYVYAREQEKTIKLAPVKAWFWQLNSGCQKKGGNMSEVINSIED
jgi:hypothetical protein